MFKTLLLAVDVNDPDGTRKSAEAAVRLARVDGAVLHVLNVLPDSGMAIVGAAFAPGHGKEADDLAHKALSDWAANVIPEGMEHHLHVLRGTVYDQIISAADRLGADAIIVGAQRPELRDYLIGPNAARVARHAKQSVFVVR